MCMARVAYVVTSRYVYYYDYNVLFRLLRSITISMNDLMAEYRMK